VEDQYGFLVEEHLGVANRKHIASRLRRIRYVTVVDIGSLPVLK